MLQKCFQTDAIFSYQGTVSEIKFQKRLTKFKITNALSKKFSSKGFISTVKVIKIYRSSGESNVEMYTPYEVRRGTSPSRNGKWTISKSNSSRLASILVETVQLDIHRFKSQKGGSVSEEFALFNCRSVGYMRFTIWSK